MLRRVAVIGAGTMGQGIVITIAQASIDVVFKELNEKNVKSALKGIDMNLDREIEKWSITKSEKNAILSRIKGTYTYDDNIKAVDLVIESIKDDFEKKSKLFTELDSILEPNLIIASNTSALSITELAGKTKRADKVVGMHFMNPVTKRPLVEIVRGLKTSDETVKFVQDFAKIINKTAIEVLEYPGRVTIRLIIPLINEAMYVVMEGVAIAKDVDTAMKLGFNFPIGPLALADQMGLDEVMLWMEHLFHELGDLKYRPCPLLRKMVRAGLWGVKTRMGFFKYDENGRMIE